LMRRLSLLRTRCVLAAHFELFHLLKKGSELRFLVPSVRFERTLYGF
jgi:hypothetical protein